MAFLIPTSGLPVRASAKAATEIGQAAPRYRGEWRDGGGNRIGKRLSFDAPSPFIVEALTEDGSLALLQATPPVRLRGKPPSKATSLALFDGSGAAFEIAAGSITSLDKLKIPGRQRFGKKTGAARMYVVADRYGPNDAAQFFADCDSMIKTCNSFAPFSESERFALSADALFWPSNTATGNFGTVDPPDPPVGATDAEKKDGKYRVIAVDGTSVWQALKKAKIAVTKDTLVVVLVKSQKRLGAGGFASSHVPWWLPAVATNHSDADIWQRVVLHEIGHAFGLIDEYDDPFSYPVQAFEPNVSKFPDPLLAPRPWCQMAPGYQGPPYTRLSRDDGQAVGANRGARYDPLNYYRPSATCMMRVAGQPFCPVCREVIAAELLGLP